MHLTGIHHLTAVTAHPAANFAFYTQTLGLRLVKKTVNQDDTSAYHLFYADGKGSPGSDITFFDWPLPRETRGHSSIARTGLRVPPNSMGYWRDRLRQLKVKQAAPTVRHGRPTLDFEDREGQRLSLVADDPTVDHHPWEKSPVPEQHQILGLGPVTLSLPDVDATAGILTEVLNMKPAQGYTSDGVPVSIFKMNAQGPAAELHLAHEPALPPASLGAGGVHHVAFRVPTFDQFRKWAERLNSFGIPNSRPIDRFYFRSLYFQEPNGILFELATDGPGFAADEPLETLGERLSLPPFLESQRTKIEKQLKPLHTEPTL